MLTETLRRLCMGAACTWLVACGVRVADTPWQPTAGQRAEIAGTVTAFLNGQADISPLALPTAPTLQVYLALWSGGERLAQVWASGLVAALHLAGADLSPAQLAAVDNVEVSLAYGFRDLDPAALGDDLSPVHRGVRGLEVIHGEQVLRFAPSQMIAENLSFERALGRAARVLRMDGQTLIDEAQLATFEAAQLVIEPEPLPGRATSLLRGNQLIPQSAVDRRSLDVFARTMQQWMLANLHPDGRMTYMYYPATGRESDNNNMIRQWMATLCLTRMGIASGNVHILGRAHDNIRYNLAAFYREERGLGLIEYRDKVKLGAIALAALAILEHPAREEFAGELAGLVAATDHLWREDGSFQTFYRPAERSADPNLHNFYPGETLLLWASLLERGADPQRAERFMRSFAYYRDWHLENRKPSFIPWHTQAYFMEWQRTGDPALRDWIFEMNDWLLAMQTHSRLAYDDTLGRFYDPAPERVHFGPPHASSTGVYLEGLIDAYQLALAEGDSERIRVYADSIERGLRSAMQLQFRDDAASWFVADMARVSGGLRTTVYNNVIRVDNVQHTLMAVLKMRAHLASQPGSPLLVDASDARQ